MIEQKSLKERIKEVRDFARKADRALRNNEEDKVVSKKIVLLHFWEAVCVISDLEEMLKEINDMSKND